MDARGIEPKEVVPASRKLGREVAAELARGASRIVVAKGRKVTEMRGGRADEEVLARMLGPTGNLRAPTVRAGKTVLVGFDDGAWSAILG